MSVAIRLRRSSATAPSTTTRSPVRSPRCEAWSAWRRSTAMLPPVVITCIRVPPTHWTWPSILTRSCARPRTIVQYRPVVSLQCVESLLRLLRGQRHVAGLARRLGFGDETGRVISRLRTDERARRLNVLSARRLNVLATRRLDVLAARGLDVLAAGRLNILAAWSLNILPAGRLDVLA